MNTSRPVDKRKAGWLLAGGVLLFGILYQFVGPGLVMVASPPVTPAMAAQGITAMTATSWSFLFAPAVAAFILGVVLALTPATFNPAARNLALMFAGIWVLVEMMMRFWPHFL